MAKGMKEEERKTMENTADQLHVKQMNNYKCPKCNQSSVYNEPLESSLIRSQVWTFACMVRSPRFICLNPKCKMNFKTTGTRFRVNLSGNLVATHPFNFVCNKNPFSLH